MGIARFYLPVLMVLAPSLLLGAIGDRDLPAGASWYVHVDLAEMRSAEAGKPVYEWLKGEVFDELQDEVGIDLHEEAERITAFAIGKSAVTMVLDGKISEETQDKLVAIGAATGGMDKLGSGDSAYYFIKPDEDIDIGSAAARYADDHVDPFSEGAYFSFAVRNKLIVTTRESDMQRLIDRKGRIAGGADAGAMLVLGADRSLLQAGMNAKEFEDEIGWDSNIVRNTEQVALLVADSKGRLAITAQLLTAEKEMAESLASIARGLISLQVFNNDMDPEISEFLQNTTVDVDDRSLTISVSLDPQVVVDSL